ncbi:hypothetical protein IT072_06030 [Leifsonia sp. ZF2019]|uniref:DUF5719 family protein n=1 Tax=Leifsonia sp. ZF2019 TaxID=2781978 RepID=UPI001CBD3C14|nr:DUF5719 family protein [Leifsonia sp. ZF2019]UAJ80580.1 hypothetical protein IT072_06030 [Leifsonia sp. ZF2019]
MADKRGIARIGARALGGLIGAGVAVVAIAGATLLPLPDFAIGAPAATVRPVPADQQRVCPGPVLALAADSGSATQASPIGEATTSYGTDGPDVQVTDLKPDSDGGHGSETPQALTVSTPHGSRTPPLFAGAQLQNAASDDLAGLTSAACAEPAADTWLVAGATSLGQTSLVLLANPTSVDATVSLSIYTETGTVSAPGATGIVVPAGGQKVVPLAGLAPAAAAPVVHVQTTGGEVVATMQQSFEQGIQPQGAELTGGTGAPSRQQVIPGMTIAGLAKVTAAQSGESVGVEFPAVRIFVPGDKDAEVTIGAVGEEATAAGTSYAQTVKSGNVAEIPLENLKDGSYTVTVNSSVPVVAAARTTSIGTKTRDFAWFVSSEPLRDTFLAAIPSGAGGTLHLTNASEKDQKVTVTPDGGKPTDLVVPAEGAANIGLSANRYTVTNADGLRGGVTFAGDGLTSAFALAPPGPLAAPIDVYAH